MQLMNADVLLLKTAKKCSLKMTLEGDSAKNRAHVHNKSSLV